MLIHLVNISCVVVNRHASATKLVIDHIPVLGSMVGHGIIYGDAIRAFREVHHICIASTLAVGQHSFCVVLRVVSDLIISSIIVIQGHVIDLLINIRQLSPLHCFLLIIQNILVIFFIC